MLRSYLHVHVAHNIQPQCEQSPVEPLEFNSQRLQVGEATKSSICDEAHAIVPDVELVQQVEANKAGFLQSG